MKPFRLILALALVAALATTVAVAGPDKGQPTEPKLIPASMAKPVYPDAERKSGVEGTVILAVDISAAGAVAGAKVDKPVDGHPAFSDAAVAAVKQWRFEPARLDGKPVGITVKIPVKFTLQEK
jgi:protein TonB